MFNLLFETVRFIVTRMTEFWLFSRAFPARKNRKTIRFLLFLFFSTYRLAAILYGNVLFGLPAVFLEILYWLVLFPLFSKVEIFPYTAAACVLLVLNTAITYYLETFYYVLYPSFGQLVCLNFTALVLWLTSVYKLLSLVKTFRTQSWLAGILLLAVPFVIMTMIYSGFIFEEDQYYGLETAPVSSAILIGILMVAGLTAGLYWFFIQHWKKKTKKMQDAWLEELNSLEMEQQQSVASISKLRHDQINLTNSLEYLIESRNDPQEAIEFIDQILNRKT